MKLTEHIFLAGSSCMGISESGDCNVYAVADGQQIYLIDCGLSPDPDRLLKNMEADGLNPRNLRGVLLTHVHPDHVGAVSAFRKMGVPVLGGVKSADVLRLGIAGYYRLETRLPPSGFRDFFCGVGPDRIDGVLLPGERLALDTCVLETVNAPGHSPDSVCYLLRDGTKKHLFTGDTLFYPGHVNYFTWPLSCPDAYPRTICRLAAIRPAGLYPGHGLFTVDRGWQCTDQAKACIAAGTLPPLKPYS